MVDRGRDRQEVAARAARADQSSHECVDVPPDGRVGAVHDDADVMAKRTCRIDLARRGREGVDAVGRSGGGHGGLRRRRGAVERHGVNLDVDSRAVGQTIMRSIIPRSAERCDEPANSRNESKEWHCK